MAVAPLGGLLTVPLQRDRLERVPSVAARFQFFQLAGLHWVGAFGLLESGRVTGFSRRSQGNVRVAAKGHATLFAVKVGFPEPTL